MRARLPRRVRSLTYSCSCPLKEKPTGDRNTESPVSELLASAQVLVSAVTGVVDEKLRAASVGDQVSPSQLKVLKLVRMAGTLTVGEVATFLCVSDAAASKTIDRMVRRKQLRRAERRSDRRSSELRLTRTGRKLLGDYESAKARKLSRLFGDFGATTCCAPRAPSNNSPRSSFANRTPGKSVCGAAFICNGAWRGRRPAPTAPESGKDGTQNKTPARGGHGMGPPG